MAFVLKYYTFSAKIRSLSEVQLRLQTNQQAPSSAEVLTILRYPQHTLGSFLQEIAPPPATLRRYSGEALRLSQTGSLNCSSLFYAVANFFDVFPLIQTSFLEIGEALLDLVKAMLPFLERECMEQLPLSLSTQLLSLPPQLHNRLIHLLTDFVLPFCLPGVEANSPLRLSVPAILMLVFQHTSDTCLHTSMLECVMCCCPGVYADMLSVLARGTGDSRVAAANLLFHYWPFANPQVLHRRSIQYKVDSWRNVPCQSTKCVEKGESVSACYDPSLCSSHGEMSPPLLLCSPCLQQLQPSLDEDSVLPLRQPLPLSFTCHSTSVATRLTVIGNGMRDYSRMRSSQESLCCSLLQPRLCCKQQKHAFETLPGCEGDGKRPKWLRQLEGGQHSRQEIVLADERRMLSRFGIWLLALTPPTEQRGLGYVMGALFEWFSTTALLPNDSLGSSLEQLKTNFVCEWLGMAIENHNSVFIEALSPSNHETEKTRESLARLLALTPYDFVFLDTWNTLIPKWLERMCTGVEEDELGELKFLLCKMFEADICPLAFESTKLFFFLTREFTSFSLPRMNAAFRWMHLDAAEKSPSLSPVALSEWLKAVRFKISQVELQTSAASPFYNI